MAPPTATTWTQWDGHRGLILFRAEWVDVTQEDYEFSSVVDISALDPAPSNVRIRSVRADVNGNFEASVHYVTIASGVVDTAAAGNAVSWISGDRFDTAWLSTLGVNSLVINGTAYTISSIASTISLALTSSPGDQSSVDYSANQLIYTFENQANSALVDVTDFTDGPSRGRVSSHGASGYIGDIGISTSGTDVGDELVLQINFEGK